MNKQVYITEGVKRTPNMWFYPFVFTGKERDKETGFGYFGARYMDHELMTMWLSVDPLADKYPSISPYAYCAWNPIKLVDPDGKEIYYKERNTYFVYKKNAEGKYGFYNSFNNPLNFFDF
ncbi:MAG: RHS repeat-associated core domain-containing protein [Bacteroidales bacterium]|nr:RHS repeat-associated core domain-containing protein [Bacteroidales bacterium]